MPIDPTRQHAIFLVYVAILLGLLAAAGLVMICLKVIGRRNLGRIWMTYASWLVLGPLGFGVIYLGRIPTILFFLFFAFLGLREFARATGLGRDRLMTGATYLLLLTTGLAAMVHDPADGSPGWFGLYMALPAFAMALVVLIPILGNRTRGQLQIISLAMLGFLYVGWMFLHLGLLADMPNGMVYLLYLLLAVELNDVAAFTFGTLFGRGIIRGMGEGDGKHLLRSQISPNKTWEGALGALAVSMILPWLMRFSLPHFGPVQLLLTGLIIGIGGQVGDLSMSVIKRDLGIKDMGTMIPGHGGVLDRIDSLIYTGPLFVHMIRCIDPHG